MFKRIEAGLHRTRHAGVTYELQREPAGTRNRQWRLHRGTGDARSYLESGIASVAEGTRTLEFILLVERHLRELGATEGGHYGWTLETRLGTLSISPRGHRVMMRFEDVARAHVELGDHHFNAYSGKWNLHWRAGTDNGCMLREFMAQLARVTTQPTTRPPARYKPVPHGFDWAIWDTNQKTHERAGLTLPAAQAVCRELNN